MRMVRQIPSETDPVVLAVQAGAQDPVAACMALYDRAAFTAAGVMVNRTDAQARMILKTFNDFHVSWFSNKFDPLAQQDTLLVRDWEEPALYITNAAFTPNTKFNSIVTLNSGLQGMRDVQGKTPAVKWDAQNIYKYRTGYPYSASKDFDMSYLGSSVSGNILNKLGSLPFVIPGPNIVDVGQLVGVKPSMSVPLPSFDARIPISNAELRTVAIGLVNAGPLNINAQLGTNTGILGSQVFYLNNINIDLETLASSFDVVPRRVSRIIEEDLLCHQLPTLQATDAQVVADFAKFQGDAYAFHQNVACLQCHSALDGEAFNYRNVFYGNSDQAPDPQNQTVGVALTFAFRMPSSPTAQTFALQPANQEGYSKLLYRENVTQIYHNVPVASLEDLAKAVAASPDLYSCAAKRYYKFFTGVDVSLVQQATAGTIDRYHQDLVMKLASGLQTNQSIRTLVNSILSSVPFQTRDYKTSGAP